MTAALSVAVLAIVVFAAWRLMKAGAMNQRAKTAEKALDQIVEANRPATAAELDRVRDKYRRD